MALRRRHRTLAVERQPTGWCREAVERLPSQVCREVGRRRLSQVVERPTLAGWVDVHLPTQEQEVEHPPTELSAVERQHMEEGTTTTDRATRPTGRERRPTVLDRRRMTARGANRHRPGKHLRTDGDRHLHPERACTLRLRQECMAPRRRLDRHRALDPTLHLPLTHQHRHREREATQHRHLQQIGSELEVAGEEGNSVCTTES